MTPREILHRIGEVLIFPFMVGVFVALWCLL